MTESKPSAFRATASAFKKTHNFFGFTKGYAFSFWFIFGGALVGFILARLHYLDIDGRFCPPDHDGSSLLPAACYWVRRFTRYRVGMILHLATSLPAGLIAVFQFMPATRRCVPYHRTAGYVAITLAFIGNIGALVLTETAIGGDIATRALMGIISLATTITFALAVYNIRRAQLDQHRAWMLRSWSYLGFIVTLRLIQFPMVSIISRWPAASKYVSVPCAELRYVYFADQRPGMGTFTQEALETFESSYPECVGLEPSEETAVYVLVKGIINPKDAGQSNAALMATFAAAGWLAILIHAVAVEVYIWLKQAETQRLRMISYQRQLERGYKNPGSAGVVAQRFGDAEDWAYPEQEARSSEQKPEETAQA
ncbi:hypothetical protein HJFPF1_07256 [Paramyrothecium foliicola]|nr:hypothetical protein HJFPF1_07256 [Paramyrothecium foliicola]